MSTFRMLSIKHFKISSRNSASILDCVKLERKKRTVCVMHAQQGNTQSYRDQLNALSVLRMLSALERIKYGSIQDTGETQLILPSSMNALI
jgi:hypothetical protein